MNDQKISHLQQQKIQLLRLLIKQMETKAKLDQRLRSLPSLPSILAKSARSTS